MRKARLSVWESSALLGFYSIADYGAKTSRADNLTQISACITAASSSGVNCVYIPSGRYITSPFTLPANFVLFGFGTLVLRAGSLTPLLTVQSGSVVMDVTLDGAFTLGANTNCDTISVASGSNRVEILGVDIYNSIGDGVSITNATDVIVSDCRVILPHKNGIKINSGSRIRLSQVDIDIVTPGGLVGSGVSIASNGLAISNVQLSNVCVSGSTIHGFEITGQGTRNTTDIAFSNCESRAAISSGFKTLNCERITFSSCIGNLSGVDGFRLEGDSQNIRVVGGIANGNTGFGMREVVVGSTPNNNRFTTCVSTNNTASNVITVVGPSSSVVG